MTKSKMVPRLLLAVGLGIGIVLAILLARERFTMAEIEHWVGRLRGWAPAIYLTLWLVVPVLCLPGTPRGLAAGALFGPVRGSLYGLVGATAGATFAFLVARYLAGEWVARRGVWFDLDLGAGGDLLACRSNRTDLSVTHRKNIKLSPHQKLLEGDWYTSQC
jgi:uncharacterized membrane protein YdjX (TVP38/TMEM64 family)